MRILSKGFRRLFLALLVVLIPIGIVLWVWVIPRLIVAAIQERHEGHVTISGWWINGSSAGVTGLSLHEGQEPSSPVWMSADRVTTDLSLWGLLHRRFSPRRIVFRHPSIQYRIDPDGHPLTRIPLRSSGGGPIPELIVQDGRLAMQQSNRPEMSVAHLDARMEPGPDGPRFDVKADDPAWGLPALNGRLGPDFTSVEFRLTADQIMADRDKASRIPFVPGIVWEHFVPDGPIGVALDYLQPAGGSGPAEIKTIVTLEKTRVTLPNLGLVGDEMTGRITVQNQVVGLEDVQGRLAGGYTAVTGSLDFSKPPFHYQLSLDVDGIELAALPASWQLDRTGIKGRTTGTASMRMTLTPRGLDLTGSTGSGRIDQAVVQGIPFQRLNLTLRSEGLRPDVESSTATPGPFLPQWIAGDFQVGDVALEKALAWAGPTPTGGSREVAISGLMALEAHARFPLGSLDDVKAYTVQGQADVSRASVAGLDLGRMKGRLDLKDGVLEVNDLRGRLSDRPEGQGPPRPADPPPVSGPLPPGGFRGRLRAELVDDRKLHLDFEGVELPVGELITPALSRDVPVTGRLTIQASADARGGSFSDPRAWTLSGNARIPRASYHKATLSDFAAAISVEHGRLVLANLSAKMGDKVPIRGQFGLDLTEPWAYEGSLETGDLPLGELLPLLPHVPDDFPVSGTLAGRAEARGALRPWRIESSGQARINHLQAGRVPVGDVPVRWTTQGDTILLSAEELQRFGGQIQAEARVPVHGDRPIEGTITLEQVDTAELSAEAPKSWKLSGRADGQARFRLQPGSGGKGPALDAEGQLSAADLTVRGIHAQVVGMTLSVHDGVPRFDVQAESLGGTIHLTGDGRIGADRKDDEIHAEVKAIAVQLYHVWSALGISGGLSELRGRGMLAGQVQTHADLKDVRARAEADLDDLTWGYNYGLGRIHANLNAAPEGWRIGPLGGELWGGPVQGQGIWMDRIEGGRSRYGVQRAARSDLAAPRPGLLARRGEEVRGIRCLAGHG